MAGGLAFHGGTFHAAAELPSRQLLLVGPGGTCGSGAGKAESEVCDNSSRRLAVPLTLWDARLKVLGGPGTTICTGGGDPRRTSLHPPRTALPPHVKGRLLQKLSLGSARGVLRGNTVSPQSRRTWGPLVTSDASVWLLVLLFLPVSSLREVVACVPCQPRSQGGGG